MYEDYYGLSVTPFRLTPDPLFFYEGISHKRGLAFLRYAFLQQEGFVVITGAPGTGKTELMLNLISELPDNVKLAKIVTSSLKAEDMLSLVASSFLPKHPITSKSALLKKLEQYLISQARQGNQVMLIIDEAHNLHMNSLVELAMLSNFQLKEKPLLQCILIGQTQLEEKLELPELAQLKQRVIVSTQLEPLSQNDTRAYIEHRLTVSGWQHDPEFTTMAHLTIFEYTDGIPRIINAVCSRILMEAYLHKKRIIDHILCMKVINEIKEEIGASTITAGKNAGQNARQNINSDQQLTRHFSQQLQPEKASTVKKPAVRDPALTNQNKNRHEVYSNKQKLRSNTSTAHHANSGKHAPRQDDNETTVVEKLSTSRKHSKKASPSGRKRPSNLDNILRPDFHTSPTKKMDTPSPRKVPVTSATTTTNINTKETGTESELSPATVRYPNKSKSANVQSKVKDKYQSKDRNKSELALMPLQSDKTVLCNLNIAVHSDFRQEHYKKVLVHQMAGKNGFDRFATGGHNFDAKQKRSHERNNLSPISGLGIVISVFGLLTFWWYIYGPGLDATLQMINTAKGFLMEKFSDFSF